MREGEGRLEIVERTRNKSINLEVLLRETVKKVQFLDWDSPHRRAGRQVERVKKTESTVLLDRQKQLVAQEARQTGKFLNLRLEHCCRNKTLTQFRKREVQEENVLTHCVGESRRGRARERVLLLHGGERREQ
jgi:hypothetical protein